jgi:putative metallohydrolase (TIGR04338 family)
VTGRDVQRARVYAAESLACRVFDRAAEADSRAVDLHCSTIVLPIERRFASIESMQTYADRVLALRWVCTEWPDRAARPVTVRARKGQTRAHYEQATATIAIPSYQHNRAWAMRELVLLHELAHHLTPGAVGPHGPEFAGTYLTLATELIGPEAGLLLRATMHESGVRVGGCAGAEL